MKSVSKAEVEKKRINRLLRQREGLSVEDEEEVIEPQASAHVEAVVNGVSDGHEDSLDNYLGHVDGEHVTTYGGGVLVSYASRGSVSTMDPLSDGDSSAEEGEYEPNQNPKNTAPQEDSSQNNTADNSQTAVAANMDNLYIGQGARSQHGVLADTNANPSKSAV